MLDTLVQPTTVQSATDVSSIETYDLQGKAVTIQVVTYGTPDGSEFDFIVPPVIVYSGPWTLTWELVPNSCFPNAQINSVSFVGHVIPPGITHPEPEKSSSTEWKTTIGGEHDQMNAFAYSISVAVDSASDPMLHTPSITVSPNPAHGADFDGAPLLNNIYTYSSDPSGNKVAMKGAVSSDASKVFAPPLALTNGNWNITISFDSNDPEVKLSNPDPLPPGITLSTSTPTFNQFAAVITGEVLSVNGFHYLMSANEISHDPAVAVVKDPLG